ncbi:unnamed protein product, partial [Timema podura]|nr:unnamed protein product [Timema podura]
KYYANIIRFAFQVEKPFTDNPYVKYVKLPKVEKGSYLKTGTKVVSAGWGITSMSRFYGESSPILLDVTLDILDNDKCSQEPFFEKFEEYGLGITEGMICTETLGKDTTAVSIASFQGVSGILEDLYLLKEGNDSTLIGVVSFGEGSGKLGDPGVYTSVVYYKKWIYLNTVSFPE